MICKRDQLLVWLCMIVCVYIYVPRFGEMMRRRNTQTVVIMIIKAWGTGHSAGYRLP